ncbi:MAG: tetratricopeptide repeat protein [Muribaculaceae bacterium]|nr:tetratricopeptide repeat protein [Muribaculaceae bacterium]
MKKYIFTVAAAAMAAVGSYAGVNTPFADGSLFRAARMYADGNYNGCIDQLSDIDADVLSPAQREECMLYRALAYVHTDKTTAASLLEQFLTDYPESIHRWVAQLNLADCYYGSDYKRALDIYKHIYADALSDRQKDDLLYRTAYCYMQIDHYDLALPLLERLDGSPEYHNAALFYRAFIAYDEKDYARALSLFHEVNTNEAPGDMADYYLSQIYYVEGDYGNALATARKVINLKDADPQFVAEAMRIAGESSYHLGNHTAAIDYLRRYIDTTSTPMPSALYILGVNAYNKSDYAEAIRYLGPVTACDDAMGQCAHLYMGQAYLNEDDYDAAAMAFNRALNMDYDSKARETAYYNYAVTSTRGGKAPFASTVSIFSEFLRLYPRSRYSGDVQAHIINSYLTDNNYAEALASINRMAEPTKSTLGAKQKVLYALGVQSLAKSDYATAIDYLTQARALRAQSQEIDNEVSLALGEAYYQDGKYSKAVTELENYLKKAPAKAVNRPLACYDLGYALYAQKKYAEATGYFDKAVSASSSLPVYVLADAYSRLGDCQYYQKKFDKALNAYDKAYEKNPESGDYALFQKALMYGYMRKHDNKIQTLEQLCSQFPSSALVPDAMLETTEALLQTDRTHQAITVYRELAEQYPNTAQGRQACLQLALVMLNSGNHNGAVTAYKDVIRRYPTSDEARQAVEQMKRIAANDGTLKEFMDFLHSTAGAPQLDLTEAELLAFEEAEQEYLQSGKTGKLAAYLYDYPSSDYRAHAILYLMESETKAGHDDTAYEYATMLAEQYPSHAYAQQALATKATTEERRGSHAVAFRTWKSLMDIASSPSMLLKARMGVIRNGRETSQHDDVIKAADAVTTSSGLGNDDLTEAIFSRALALNAKGETRRALTDWESIADNTSSLFGIQSACYAGEYYLKNNDLKKAERMAKEAANADSPHTYWIARGFILLSDVYKAQGDKYKARQYLEALRDNYQGNEPDIMEMIESRLK